MLTSVIARQETAPIVASDCNAWVSNLSFSLENATLKKIPASCPFWSPLLLIEMLVAAAKRMV